jgi:ribosome biogenesis GTPase
MALDLLSRLASLGWRGDEDQPADGDLARVAAVDRHQLLLLDGSGTRRAVLTGRFLHDHENPADRPCVGDWVRVEAATDGGPARVSAVLPRRTLLSRKMAGDQVAGQVIAANIDHVVVVQACHFDFNPRRLERYLVMVRAGGAEPWVLLTKTDLVNADTLAGQLDQMRAVCGNAPLLTLSNQTREGLDEFAARLRPGDTHCFVGSSGVGKSTLLNHLLGKDRAATGDVSATGEGRHTTVRRELVVLGNGALVIDNPGMREFGLLGGSEGLVESFSAIAERAAACRYRDCTHTDEPGCAVRAAVEAGEIPGEGLASYHKLRSEDEHNQRSSLERRQKERDFGRFVKAAKKDLRSKR